MSSRSWVNQVTVYFVIGAPGAGKGTLCARIAQDFPIYHLSVGDYLRAICLGQHSYEDPSEYIGQVNEYLQRRELLPPGVIVPILLHKIQLEHERVETAFLIDGFPRDKDSAILFEREVWLAQCKEWRTTS